MSDIKKRGVIKAKLTLFIKYLDNLPEDLTEVEIIQLKERLPDVAALKEEFETTQSRIEVATESDDALGVQLEEREKFESSFYSQMSKSKKLIIEYEAKNIANSEMQLQTSLSTASTSQNFDAFSQIKLPTINLPKFHGLFQTWLEFRDTYKSLIHENSAISPIQKFHYLRASLEGTAAQIIQSLEISSANYDVAWKTLSERYDNDHLLIHNHVKSLFNCESVVTESAVALRKLIDTISKNLRALEQLKQPVKEWDTLLIYLISTKLDSVTLREWETFKKNTENLTFDALKQFLNSRANLLEMVSETHPDKRKSSNANTRGFVVTGGDQNVSKCAFCKQNHYIQNCSDFLKLNIKERIDKVRYIKLCINCLKGGHGSKVCRHGTCLKCGSKHHTLLHLEQRNFNNTQSPSNNSSLDNNHSLPEGEILESKPSQSSKVILSAYSSVQHVFLSTVLVQVLNKNAKPHTVRALLDSEAQSSFITSELFKVLQIKETPTNIIVKGINGISSNISAKCDLRVEAIHNSFQFTNSFFIIDTISQSLPIADVDIAELKIPNNLKLADPSFVRPDKIEMLIGADMFWQLICIGQISLGPNKPILQKTRFGWIVAGPMGLKSKNMVCNFIIKDDEININKTLSRFWEIEEVDLNPVYTLDESHCEKHFIENFNRDTRGRFIVSLPLKDNIEQLGSSYDIAYKRFLNLERKLYLKPEMKKLYTEFIQEYLQLGHMQKVENLNAVKVSYYMPHRGVIRQDSLTTKIRVVFDASCPTSSGYSWNNLQYVGPTLQQELFSILLRFRQHKYVFSADIAKMYRQVLISPDQRSLQRILWRENSSDPLSIYELKTVTYGTAAASYLVIRCLFQLAYESESQHPNLAHIIKTDFYVDDLLSGADTLEEAALICSGIADILKTGCFELRKFYSNHSEVLKYVKSNNIDSLFVNFGEYENAKTLGVTWMPSIDQLVYKINNNYAGSKITKRSILSDVSQIFDPLGLLAPCIIIAKVLLQKLWLEKLTWDESVPPHIHTQWQEFKTQLLTLNEIRIPRHVICDKVAQVEMHGFSDASQTAYGACVYVRSLDENGEIFSHLLCAKSKVAPLKTISIPRLELCSALLLARLAKKVRNSLRLTFARCIFWSDSTIVLGWLKSPPSKFNTFVSNRVAEIQELTSSDKWRHVSSNQNPADIISRGIKPDTLMTNNLWWQGPSFLRESSDAWPKKDISNQKLPDTKKNMEPMSLTATLDNSIIKQYSCLQKLKRVTAWLIRFSSNCKLKDEFLRNKSNYLSVAEIQHAFNIIVKMDQFVFFNTDIVNLSAGTQINRNSILLSLNPFIDEMGLLRVGGRLNNSRFPFEKKHPLILHSKSPLMLLIARQLHIDLLHAGPQHMIAAIRETFWPIGGRILMKAIVRKCVSCFRYRPQIIRPIMAALPKDRLNPRQPFEVTGVDYAGPLLIKSRSGRGCKISKAYICLFICATTKAVHIELVSDLSKEYFLLALKRFIARRGTPSQMLSDNGSNFVSARSELRELGTFLAENEDDFSEYLQKNEINWKFNPPYAPHFGGLWEAGVKSIKHHLRRVTKGIILTFEQLSTLLTQIEAILNSRPLSPLSDSPHDLNPLTPSHFLIGRPSSMVPESNVSDVPSNRLTLFQHLVQLKQHVWNRWSKEYVSELQARTKWKQNHSSLLQGALVLIKEDSLPPMKWRLGRVHDVIKGPDGIGRVALLKTQQGFIKRSFTKICPLLMEEDM